MKLRPDMRGEDLGLHYEQAVLLADYLRISSELRDADLVNMAFKAIRTLLRSVRKILEGRYGRLKAGHSMAASTFPKSITVA